MVCIEGKVAFGGIAIGPLREMVKKSKVVRRVRIENTEAEKARFERARTKAQEQLSLLYEKAVKEVGETNAAIFEVHQMMLEDDDYLDSVRNIIEIQQVNAEYAVATTGDNFAAVFTGMEDDYMKERAADVRDVSERVIQVLSADYEKKDVSESIGTIENTKFQEIPEGTKSMGVWKGKNIILADDLAPSETIQLDRSKVLGFVTRFGSINSHTAILARTMNIPALVCTPVGTDLDGKLAIIDGFGGKIIVDPEEEVLAEYKKKQEEEQERRNLLLALKNKKTQTKSGKSIMLYANIGGISDVEAVLSNDAEGIGLFRSEFLYLQNKDFPTEEEQFLAYKRVAEMMAGKKVIIRTLDIGADKQVDYFDLGKEENPALGYRAVRICLDQPEIFKTQLRAIYRASAFGNVAIMVPMIISLWEIKKVKEIIEEIKMELNGHNIEYGDVEFGIMIETPASAMMADEFAKEVDFFSIGTNDLTQYTLAIDRQNAKLDMFYDAHHPAVLRMIRMVIDSAHKAGIWAGICGELGADTRLTETFVRMGIDELSVSPASVLPVRSCIIEIE